ncbi:MAG: hypothetical protein HY868_00810 [Chloroflexi bacterium]|nr:hypothetical protein [Chloroflexota bacterium]
MTKTTIFRALLLVAIILIVSVTFVSAATFVLQITGAGTVNGTPDEWGTPDASNPYYITDLCINGDCVNQPRVGRLFAHYTCDNDMVYMYVAPFTGLTYTTDATNNFLAQNTLSNILMNDAPPYTTNTNQNQPIWRDLTPAGSGFEAGYPFARGVPVTLTVNAIISSTTASTSFHTFGIPGCVPTAVSLSNLRAEATGGFDIMLSGIAILGLIGVAGVGLFVWRRTL